MIICSQCGSICAETSVKCGDCGAAIPVRFAGGMSSTTYTPQQAAGAQPHAQGGGYLPPPPMPPTARPLNPANHLLWIVPIGLIVILVAVVSLKSSRVADSSTSRVSPAPAPTVSPYANARLVYCRFNGVHVRDSPNLNAFIITDIQQGQAIRVLRESSNYDTVFVRSLNQNITDNWSEIQIENTSIRGWVFSGFLR